MFMAARDVRKLNWLLTSVLFFLLLSGCTQTRKAGISTDKNALVAVVSDAEGKVTEIAQLHIPEGWEKAAADKKIRTPWTVVRPRPGTPSMGEVALVRYLPRKQGLDTLDDFMNLQKKFATDFCQKEISFFVSPAHLSPEGREVQEWKEMCLHSKENTHEFVTGKVVRLNSSLLIVLIHHTGLPFDSTPQPPASILGDWLESDKPILDGFRVEAAPVATKPAP